MSDEDDVDDLLNEIKSDDGDASSDSADDDSDIDQSDFDDSNHDTVPEENAMSSDDDAMADDEGSTITQAEVYDNLKRIGELEDEKQTIQEELRRRTDQLRAMLKHIDRNSILYKMLQSALPAPAPRAASSSPKKSAAPKTAPKKTAKKKGRRK